MNVWRVTFIYVELKSLPLCIHTYDMLSSSEREHTVVYILHTVYTRQTFTCTYSILLPLCIHTYALVISEGAYSSVHTTYGTNKTNIHICTYSILYTYIELELPQILV